MNSNKFFTLVLLFLLIVLAMGVLMPRPASAQSAELNPQLAVQPDHGWIKGLNWPPGIDVTVTVYSDMDVNEILWQGTEVTSDGNQNGPPGFAYFEPDIELVPGQYATMTGGDYEKSMMIVSISFDSIDIENDTAWGTGPANHSGGAQIETDADSYFLPVNFDENGDWALDFGVEGFDLVNVLGALVFVEDDDGDLTVAHYPIPEEANDIQEEITEIREDEDVYGIFSNHQVWKGEIHVIGDVIIEQGASLTIEPGTVVWITANSDAENLNTDWEPHQRNGINMSDLPVDGVESGEPFWDEPNRISIKIRGILNAVGSPELPIVFTSDGSRPTAYDWNTLEIENGELSYAIIEYHRMVQGYDNVIISHNIVRNSGEQGVGSADNTSPIIEYNYISYAGHELIYLHGGSPIVRYNVLGPNPFGNNGVQTGGIGIAIVGGNPQIIGNVIIGCHEGLVYVIPPDEGIILENNILLNNAIDSRGD